jgi:hypothetical protein
MCACASCPWRWPFWPSAWRGSWPQSLARRVNALTAFVDTMLDQQAVRPPLVHGDDELGELTRSVARMTPKIASWSIA